MESYSTGWRIVVSVAGIFGSSFINYAAKSIHSRMQQARQEFQQLGQDLQSGNLSVAQSDFAAPQKLGPQSKTRPSTQNSASLSQDLQQLSQDLQSGNTAAAQQDYSRLQQDFQSQALHTHRHQHHGGGSSTRLASYATAESTRPVIAIGRCVERTAGIRHVAPGLPAVRTTEWVNADIVDLRQRLGKRLITNPAKRLSVPATVSARHVFAQIDGPNCSSILM